MGRIQSARKSVVGRAAMKLGNKESFLPSTKKGKEWAEHSLSLVKSTHPLWSVEELYQAIQDRSIDDIILELESVSSSSGRQLLDGLQAVKNHNRIDPDSQPLDFLLLWREYCFSRDWSSVYQEIDRWIFKAGFSSIRCLQRKEFSLRIQSIAQTVNDGCYFLDIEGGLWCCILDSIEPVNGLEKVEVISVSDASNTVYALDRSGTIWIIDNGGASICGQHPSATQVLSTASGPLVFVPDGVVLNQSHFQLPISVTPSSRLYFTDSEILFVAGPKSIQGYSLRKSDIVYNIDADTGNADTQLMRAAILDMAGTNVGLKVLCAFRFWERNDDDNFRMMQSLGEILSVRSDNQWVISLDESHLLRWKMVNNEPELLDSFEIPDSWSVATSNPMASDYSKVVLQTSYGLRCVDILNQKQVNLFKPLHFYVKVFSLKAQNRFGVLGNKSFEIFRVRFDG
jgi:hypothetical protein